MTSRDQSKLPPGSPAGETASAIRSDIAVINRAADDAGMPIPYCPKCCLPLNADHTHRTYEEHDACRNKATVPEPVPTEGAADKFTCGDERQVEAVTQIQDKFGERFLLKHPNGDVTTVRIESGLYRDLCPKCGTSWVTREPVKECPTCPAAPEAAAARASKTLDVERAENWLAAYYPKLYSRQTAELLHDYSLTVAAPIAPAALDQAWQFLQGLMNSDASRAAIAHEAQCAIEEVQASYEPDYIAASPVAADPGVARGIFQLNEQLAADSPLIPRTATLASPVAGVSARIAEIESRLAAEMRKYPIALLAYDAAYLLRLVTGELAQPSAEGDGWIAELRDGLKLVRLALADENLDGVPTWTRMRFWLNQRDIYNGDLQEHRVTLEVVKKLLTLLPPPVAKEGRES